LNLYLNLLILPAMQDQQHIKQALYQACEEHINERIASIQKKLTAIQESRNNETKSSSGDKFETGRAMMHIEEQNNKVQLSEAFEVKKKLAGIGIKKTVSHIKSGSLVITNRGNYFISIGIGKVKIADTIYFCLSPNSPIGMKMIGKEIGDEIAFNQNKITVKSIY